MTNAALHLKVDHALQAVTVFSDFLEKETEVLNASDFAAFETLQDYKLDLARNYQQAILAFEEDADLLPTLEDDLKDQLRAAHLRFSEASQANQSTLLAAKNVSERVVNLVMDAAKKSVIDETPSYSAGALQGLSQKIPVHFKLNETI